MDNNNLEQRFENLKDKFIKDKGTYESLIKQKTSKLSEIDDLKCRQQICDKARILLLKTAEVQRSQIKADIEDMVSKALRFIREEDITFTIKPVKGKGKDSELVRGRTEYEFLVKTVRNGITSITNIMDSRGDGISDIASLALDIAMIELANAEGPLILDEPAKQLSKGYIGNVGHLLQQLSISFGRQIILITHHNSLLEIGNRKISVELVGTESQLTVA